MEPKFTHLHVHSHYSLLDGLPKIPELLDRVSALGMNSVALTDHGVMYGLIEFYQEAKKRNIKPILGIEVYLARGSHQERGSAREENYYHLTLLAKNLEGYENLIKLTTIAHLKGFYYRPRIDKELLKKYRSGLIALSGCIGGELSQTILNHPDKAETVAREYQKIFGRGNYFIEIMDMPNLPDVKTPLIRSTRKLNLPLVATADSHYLKKEDAEAQDILLCVQTGKKVQEKDRLSMLDGDYSLRAPKEMLKAFSDLPETIENTQKIADLCQVEIKLDQVQLPQYPLPPGETAPEYLKKLALKGLKKRYPQLTQKIKKRFAYELELIKSMGFCSYMLIVEDFVSWAKNQGIVVGPGRGSAAGSLVSYCLNITDIDPLKYGLLFERFLNPGRNELPDIDLDFADHRRDEVIKYVKDKYGSEHVAQIITFGTMAARAAVRDVGRTLDLPYAFCDEVAKLIPTASGITIQKAFELNPELKQKYDTDSEC